MYDAWIISHKELSHAFPHKKAAAGNNCLKAMFEICKHLSMRSLQELAVTES